MGCSYLGGPFTIDGLELALDARIWESEGDKRKTWAENGRTICSLGLLQVPWGLPMGSVHRGQYARTGHDQWYS